MRKSFVVLGGWTLMFSCLATQVSFAQNSQLRLFHSVLVEKPPRIDGQNNDDAWSKATPVKMSVEPAEGGGKQIDVRVMAVHTAEEIYFLISWPDNTKDDSHKTWTWNEATKSYEEGTDREDVAAIAFAHTGYFSGDMLSGHDNIWDVWHWKAARTNPSGFAMDKTHVYTREKPEGKAKSFKANDGHDIWIARPKMLAIL